MNPVTRRVHVRVPATSANLGSGFDTVGLALDYHDELTFTLSDDPADTAAHVIIEGEGAQYGVSISSEPGKGTAVTITIPAQEKESKDPTNL